MELDYMAITDELRAARRELRRLKDVMEHPGYKGGRELSGIRNARRRMESARRKLIEVGGSYTPSAVERRDEEFNRSLPYISKIELYLCSYLGGSLKKTVRFNDGEATVETDGLLLFENNTCPVEAVDKKRFLKSLKALHIGEWRRKYDLSRFGILVCDGVYWSIGFYYSNGIRAKKFSGSNRFPYNFSRLLEIFGVER